MTKKLKIAGLRVSHEVRDTINRMREKRLDRRAGIETADDVLRRVLNLKKTYETTLEERI